MKFSILALCLIFRGLVNPVEGNETPVGLRELPRPNSGTFSFEEAESRKREILSNRITNPILKWNNPYQGFSIHIHSDESITYYGHWLRPQQRINAPSLEQIKSLTGGLPVDSNLIGILVTSEKSLRDSRVINKVLEAFFDPSIQLFYIAISGEDSGRKPAIQPGSK